MGKTRAQIQREYRQRKKAKEGDEYVQRERDRIKKYYTPIANRTKQSVKERREKVKRSVRQHRQRVKSAKERLLQEATMTSTEPATSSVDDQVSSTVADPVSSTVGDDPLTVKLPFMTSKTARSRRRVSRVTSKHRREIERLKQANATLKRKVWSVSKKYTRTHNKLQDRIRSHRLKAPETVSIATPRKRTLTELRKEGISPTKVSNTIVKKLLLANTMSEEVKAARDGNGKRGKAAINQIISGRIIKKYRMKAALGRLVGIDRHSLKSTSKKSHRPTYKRLYHIQLKVKQQVLEFLTRDDNSRQMPGKNDCKKADGNLQQKRVLNDSLRNLHLKFISEFPEVKIAFSTFCRMRPHYIILTKFISRNQCLCQKHQNFSFLLKAARRHGANIPPNPEDFIKSTAASNPNEVMFEINTDNVTYEQWKRVDCQDGKKRMKIVPHTCSKGDFSEFFVRQTGEFLEHTDKIKQQYQAISDLKKGLPEKHIIVQMDFAENFSCTAADEVQSAYWNQSAITLHPVVVYYRSEEGSLLHLSYIFVSDDLGHNSGAVFAFLKKLLPQLQQDIGEIRHVHYWTDSPSSQYRNKSIFTVISGHRELFGCSATWNYFEVGHGKGPCDGLGGTAKRMADISIRQNKCQIQEAKDFHQWATTAQSSVTYVLVDTSYVDAARKELEQLCEGVVPLKGTMKLHAVISDENGHLRTRITSCYCHHCLSGDFHSDWARGEIRKAPSGETGLPTTADTSNELQGPELVSDDGISQATVELADPTSAGDSETHVDVLPVKNQFVAAVYNGAWYIGRVDEVDSNDNTYQISFMERCMSKGTTSWKWPRKTDVLWMESKDFISIVKEPQPVGRCGRSFRLDDEEVKHIDSRFKVHS